MYFYSRWEKKYEMKGWLGHCEIAHAVADQLEGPYKYVSTVLSPPCPGYFDGNTCHIQAFIKIDGRYWLILHGRVIWNETGYV